MSVTWTDPPSTPCIPQRAEATDDPDICDLGITAALDDTEHEIYAGMVSAAIVVLCALLTLSVIAAWLIWRSL